MQASILPSVNKCALDCVRLPSRARRKAPKIIVIHHTVTHSPAQTQAVLKARGLSTHFEIARDGSVYQYLDPAKDEAFHAGLFNIDSIGIDLTHMTGAPFPEPQIAALSQLLRDLCARFAIPCTLAPEGAKYYGLEAQGDGSKKSRRNDLPAGIGIFRHSNLAATRCPDGAPIERAIEMTLA